MVTLTLMAAVNQGPEIGEQIDYQEVMKYFHELFFMLKYHQQLQAKCTQMG